jgi:hypothetical protein
MGKFILIITTHNWEEGASIERRNKHQYGHKTDSRRGKRGRE